MPKKDNETYIEYKKRVIDPISNSFCAAKWYNATIWLANGTTASCHHPLPHKIDFTKLDKNPTALHNTDFKKEQRRLMQIGKRPSECDYCWKIEATDCNTVSDRIFKTMIYEDEAIFKLANTPHTKDINLKTLEIAFDRNCNHACSYCNASHSSRWALDIKKNGPYQNLVSDGAIAYQQDGSIADPYSDNIDNNPYIQAFWMWWPALTETLQEFRITGGEPLLSPDVWKLFDYFQKHDVGDMLFSLNSNLSANDKVIEKLIEKSHYIKYFDIYTSCESVGRMAEYVRDGLNFETFCDNIKKILTCSNIRQMNVMMTIDILSLYGITDLMELILEWKSYFKSREIIFTVNILRFPSFMSPASLPDKLKEERKEHLRKWLSKMENHPMLREIEIESVTRLIKYLAATKVPHKKTSSLTTRHHDFKSFYKQYDKRRNKNYNEVFPETIIDWMNSIPDVYFS